MKKGFSHVVAPDLVRQKPGMTAEEVAELALRRGLCSSDAKKTDPKTSLGNTLAKEVREGRLPEIRAERVGGVLCYYPASDGPPRSSTTTTSPPTSPDEPVSIRLPREKVEVADFLVEAGQFSTRSEALAYLVGEGIARNHPQIEKVRQACQGLFDNVANSAVTKV